MTTTIIIRESTCATNQSSFSSGTTVCVRTSGTISGSGGTAWSVRWSNPSNTQIRSTGYNAGNGVTSFGPNDDSFLVSDLGTWTIRALQ
jgi:hypothetical protein